MSDEDNGYWLTCAECAVSREMIPGEEIEFEMRETESLGSFFLLHRGHVLMFTSKV